jgi:nitrogen regulatory protein PII
MCNQNRGRKMKKIETVIMPFKLGHVRDTLAKIGITGMTVSEVRVSGGENGPQECYRGCKCSPAFTAKIKIELAVPEDDLENILAIIRENAENAPYGGEKVLMYSLDDTMRARRGE